MTEAPKVVVLGVYLHRIISDSSSMKAQVIFVVLNISASFSTNGRTSFPDN